MYSISSRNSITARKAYSNFFTEIQRPYAQHSISTKPIQHNPLNYPSVYVINRKTLLRNRMQMNYNDDQSPNLCSALSVNCLKWSKSFLGDMIHYYHYDDKDTELLRNVALRMDKPQLMVFDVGNSTYTFLPTTTSSINYPAGESTLAFDNSMWMGSVRGKQKMCMDNLSLTTSYNPLDVLLILQSSVYDAFFTMYGNSDKGRNVIKQSSQLVNDKSQQVKFEDIIDPLWVDSDLKSETRGGEIISDGILGSCFNKCSNQHMRNLSTRLQLQYISASHDMIVNNCDELGVSYRTGANDTNILQLIPGNLSILPIGFKSCPEQVAHDAIHM